MTQELAEHISLLAAPIYAALLAPFATGEDVPVGTLNLLRKQAITQAQALWLQVLDTPKTDVPVLEVPAATVIATR